jgi:protein-disulfide isomerase
MLTLSRRMALLALPVMALVACGPGSSGATKPDAGKPGPAAAVSNELGHVKGDVNAPITLIEYASPTCPACKYFHDAILPTLEEKYISTGKVKFVYREFPIHDQVDVAAYAVALCAGEDKYFAVLDDLFENQDGIVQAAQVGALGTTLKTLGKRHGIETDKAFEDCLANPKHRDYLAEVYESGAKLGVGGTPTFVLDGKVRNFEGDFRTPEGFSAQIDAALAAKAGK